MRAVGDWLAEYDDSHRNSTNKLLHWICVPAIVLALIGGFASLPVPAPLAPYPALNWASLAVAAALLYYLALSPALAAGMLLAFAALLGLAFALAQLPWPLWLSSLVIFVLAWVGQFAGHAVEGRRPSFLKDLQFLLIGPLWLLAAAYRRLRLRY